MLQKSQKLLKLINSGGRKVFSKKCHFCDFPKITEKLKKSKNLVKGKGGRRVPGKMCDFCALSKNCEKVPK